MLYLRLPTASTISEIHKITNSEENYVLINTKPVCLTISLNKTQYKHFSFHRKGCSLDGIPQTRKQTNYQFHNWSKPVSKRKPANIQFLFLVTNNFFLSIIHSYTVHLYQCFVFYNSNNNIHKSFDFNSDIY